MLQQQRVARLRRRLEEEGLDAVYLGPSSDLEYLSGLVLFPDERPKGLMVSRSGLFALTPMLYQEDMGCTLGADVPLQVWEDHQGFLGAWTRGCEALGLAGKRIAVNDGMRAVDLLDAQGALPGTYLNGARLLEPLRRRKDPEELDKMRQASKMADEVVRRLAAYLRPGQVERELSKKILEWFEELGADDLSFQPIVASGPNGSMPHYGGCDRVIQENDLVIFDLGCRYRGYCSDTTRTLFVGEPTAKQKEVYEIVRQAQVAGEAAVRPGVPAQEVDRAARKVIADAGYGNYFLNRLGHGIGVAVHEAPYIIEGSELPLEVGNVFSIEPGIYLPGEFGVRIENLVAVTETGCEPLNAFPRELTVAG